MSVGNFVLVILVVLIIYVIYLGIKIVPQSKVFVIERFGKFTRILDSGLSIIVPFVDNVAHRVDILERQLPAFTISVITEDNVEVGLSSTVLCLSLAESRILMISKFQIFFSKAFP